MWKLLVSSCTEGNRLSGDVLKIHFFDLEREQKCAISKKF